MNQKRYWLSWGLILGIIVSGLIVIFELGLSSICRPANNSTGCLFAQILEIPIYLLLIPEIIVSNIFFSSFTQSMTSNNVEVAFHIVLSFLIYFVIGAFLAWIYGKFKNRNINNQNI
jgi:hypothetical protein